MGMVIQMRDLHGLNEQLREARVPLHREGGDESAVAGAFLHRSFR